MTQTRDNTSEPVPERIERTYNIGDRWYFELRGGGQMGPFDNREDMETALLEFIALQQEMKQKQ